MASLATLGVLAAAVLASSPFVGEPGDGGQTTVRAARPVEIDDDRVWLDDAALLPGPEDALLSALGASLVHDGGPLAPARLLVRGLAGARLGVDVGGLDLADPATGLVDVAALPWAFSDALVLQSGVEARGRGGTLKLEPTRRAGIRGRVLAGSLATARGSLVASAGDVLVAVDGGTTRGDFLFVPTSATGGPPGGALVRDDNDQRRASALGVARLAAGDTGDAADVEARALVFAAGHAGGIPGLATSPTRRLRGEDGLAGARVSVERKTSHGRLALAVDGRAAHRATEGPADARSVIESLGGGVSVDARAVPVALPWTAPGAGGSLDVGVGADTAHLADGSFGRTAASLRAGLRAPLDGSRQGPRLRASVDVRVLSDAGLLAGGEVHVETGDALRASLGVARGSRAPTLDELYAPRGLVLGNPALRPEIFDEIEAALAFAPGRVLEVKAVAHGGLVEEGIAWVNRNAYEIAPVNLGPAERAGIDASISIEPNHLLGLRVVASALWSRVEETGAPLPLAPPFSSLLALRLGPAAGGHLTASVRSRGPAASNLFGTLVAAPYTLVDLVARLPVDEHLDLGLSVLNALDVLDARDANQLPLPGRLAFLSLEVRG